MLCYVRFGGARGLETQTLCYAMFVLVEPRASKRKPYAMLCSFWWSQGPQNANPMLCYVRFGGARGLKTQTLCYAMFVLVEPRASKCKPYAHGLWNWNEKGRNLVQLSWLMHGCWRLVGFEGNSPKWLLTRQCNFPNVGRPLSQEKRGGYFARIILFLSGCKGGLRYKWGWALSSTTPFTQKLG